MNICKKEHKNPQGIWEKCAVRALFCCCLAVCEDGCAAPMPSSHSTCSALCRITSVLLHSGSINDRWKYHAPDSLCATARAPSPSSHCLHHNLHPREGSSPPRWLYFTPSQTTSPLWASADNDLSRVWDNLKPLGSSQLLLLMALEAISWLVFKQSTVMEEESHSSIWGQSPNLLGPHQERDI